MSEETPEVEENTETEERTIVADEAGGWEFWAKASVALAVVMATAWIVVFLKLGTFSVTVHAMVIPTLGALTLAILAWGLIRALFKPPAFRKSRLIAFGVLLATGFVGNQPIVAPPLATDDWESENRYLLPFSGKWLTMAGGREKDRNYNATTAAIRYAYDFTRVVSGEKHRLDGAKNEDFYCWGEPIFAPTSGTVVRTKNDLVDNTPGEITSEEMFGNHVVIEAGYSEYVFVWHLKKGSVAVEAGDEVTTSTVIGECGNSGRSVEPHVKVHAQDRMDFPIALGLPIEFSNFNVVDGKRISKGMPLGSSEWGAMDGLIVSNAAERR